MAVSTGRPRFSADQIPARNSGRDRYGTSSNHEYERGSHPLANKLGNGLARGRRDPKVPVHHAFKPQEIARPRGFVQVHLLVKRSDAFGSGLLPKDRLGRVPWQQQGGEEDQHGNDEEDEHTRC